MKSIQEELVRLKDSLTCPKNELARVMVRVGEKYGVKTTWHYNDDAMKVHSTYVTFPHKTHWGGKEMWRAVDTMTVTVNTEATPYWMRFKPLRDDELLELSPSYSPHMLQVPMINDSKLVLPDDYDGEYWEDNRNHWDQNQYLWYSVVFLDMAGNNVNLGRHCYEFRLPDQVATMVFRKMRKVYVPDGRRSTEFIEDF